MEQYEQNQNNDTGHIESRQNEHETSRPSETQSLAQWLLEVMQSQPSTSSPATFSVQSSHATSDEQLDHGMQGQETYHPRFYQQLPDFVFALLNNDSQAMAHYGSLLFHLIACSSCYEGFLEIYQAMNAALYPRGPRPVLGQGTRTLSAMPQSMLEYLCKVWITQAEEVLRLAKRDGTNQDELARLLLRQAIQMSSHITQYMLRRQALTDLVRVATLFDEDQNAQREQPTHSYTPVLAGGRGTMRRAEVSRLKDVVPENVPLVLQSHTLEGTITQQDQVLVLHLRDLNTSLHGSRVVVSILLGSLLEPIRWSGGNPLAIRSSTEVDASGAVTLTLGETQLHLNNPEERNMLEATFLLVEVRRAE